MRRRLSRKSINQVLNEQAPPSQEPVNDFETFTSIEAFLDACHRPSEIPDNVRASRSTHATMIDISTVHDFSEVLDLAKRGWLEGSAMAKEMSARLRGQFPGEIKTRHEWRPQVYGGGTLNIASYLQGRPDCYLHRTKERDNRFARILINIGATSSISPETIIMRGVAAAALADYLEMNGYRIHVVMVSKALGRHGSSIGLSVLLKDFHESLDLDRLTFFTAHPAILRRLVFSYRESRGAIVRAHLGVDESWGYGSSTEVPEMCGADDIYFGCARHDNSLCDEASTAAYLRGLLKTHNIEE